MVLAGFLGSGKTTVALQIARAARAAGQRVGLIVNERGEAGVDNQLAARLGFDVRELLGGCICCSLVAELAPALEALAATSRPDLVIVEPSGIAEPAQIREALRFARVPGLQILPVGIVDAQRLEELMQVVTPLITRQIGNAELVLVCKADVATARETAVAARIVDEHHPVTEPYVIDAREPLEAPLRMAMLGRCTRW
ncbi:MAG: GTP-binding protein [Steroidobacteraceae bacterium]